jgi:hypothetical protein
MTKCWLKSRSDRARHDEECLDRQRIELLDGVQILVLADLDRRVALRVEGLERGQIRTTFIDCDRLGLTVLIDFSK